MHLMCLLAELQRVNCIWRNFGLCSRVKLRMDALSDEEVFVDSFNHF